MRRRFQFFLLAVLFYFLPGPLLFSGEFASLPPFTSNDRVLVLAPHPDDETLGAGGAIEKAVKAGAQVRVVLFTNGENNKLAFSIYKKSLVLGAQASLEMGRERRLETIHALKILGVNETNVISLGYPDFGTLKILIDHWDKNHPYSSLAARQKQVPFKEDFSPGALYTGDNILKDLESILNEFKPTKIFVSHPADEHRDHRALYLFTRVALWDLASRFPPPQIHPYLVHLTGWPNASHGADFAEEPPVELESNGLSWRALNLSHEEIKTKREAILHYPSQIPYSHDTLTSYARTSEIFSDYADVPLPRQNGPEIHWQVLDNYNPVLLTQKTAQEKFVSEVAYAREEDRILIRVKLKFLRNRMMGVSVMLLGYQRNVPFARMPKIQIFSRLDSLSVRDKRENLKTSGVTMTARGKELIFSAPLSLFNSPDFILTAVKTRRAWDMSVDETAWRVLSLES